MSERTTHAEASTEASDKHVLKAVAGRTLTFKDGSTVEVDAGVHVKLDGQSTTLDQLQAGDRVQCCNGEDGKTLAVLKVRRKVSDDAEGSTSPLAKHGAEKDQ